MSEHDDTWLKQSFDDMVKRYPNTFDRLYRSERIEDGEPVIVVSLVKRRASDLCPLETSESGA